MLEHPFKLTANSLIWLSQRDEESNFLITIKQVFGKSNATHPNWDFSLLLIFSGSHHVDPTKWDSLNVNNGEKFPVWMKRVFLFINEGK